MEKVKILYLHFPYVKRFSLTRRKRSTLATSPRFLLETFQSGEKSGLPSSVSEIEPSWALAFQRLPARGVVRLEFGQFSGHSMQALAPICRRYALTSHSPDGSEIERHAVPCLHCTCIKALPSSVQRHHCRTSKRTWPFDAILRRLGIPIFCTGNF